MTRTTSSLEEAAEWFCDNPNLSDIEDELKEIDLEAYRRGQIWAIELLYAWAAEASGDRKRCWRYVNCAEELHEAMERMIEEEGQ